MRPASIYSLDPAISTTCQHNPASLNVEEGWGYSVLVSFSFFIGPSSNYLTDAGGPRGISQLQILSEMMRRWNFDVENDLKDRPYAVFDMIGGVGTGG